MRARSRGVVLILVSLIGLAAEAISMIQDGIGGPKVIALACFAFLFWWGWEMAQRPKAETSPKGSKAEKPGPQ
jgi:threonine/homoserine/homoserine lactone efflux protein